MLICLKSKIKELKNRTNDSSKQLVDIPEETGNESNNEEGIVKNTVKIFLNQYHEETINEALNYALKSCSSPPNIILAYAPTSSYVQNGKFMWCDCEDKIAKENFKELWTQLRKAREEGRVGQLGISDMDLDTIKDLFNDNYDFTTLQINISTCCVVPPELTQFCKDHKIQLLTHSDPQCILTKCILDELNMKAFKVRWIARFTATLLCRGILQKKGFIVNFQRA